jgi:asparagine synthetase B (glutamine-hydrolysing)
MGPQRSTPPVPPRGSGQATRGSFPRSFVANVNVIAASATATAAAVTQHHGVEPTATGLINDLGRLVLDHEEPVLGSSVYAQWCIVRAAACADVVVLLDGRGADEAFGGYDALRGMLDPRRGELMRCAAARWASRVLCDAIDAGSPRPTHPRMSVQRR